MSAAVTPAVFGADGAIDIIVSGASSPYTYNWDNNATTQDLNNLDGGTYVVTITDSLGCTYSDSIVVNSIVGLDIQDLNAAQVFPNPSNGDFFIVSPALSSVILYNSFGQKVTIELSSIGEGKYQVLTQELANGSYILELQSEDAVVRKALQVIR